MNKYYVDSAEYGNEGLHFAGIYFFGVIVENGERNIVHSLIAAFIGKLGTEYYNEKLQACYMLANMLTESNVQYKVALDFANNHFKI